MKRGGKVYTKIIPDASSATFIRYHLRGTGSGRIPHLRETVNAVVEEPSEDCSMYTYTSLATVRKNLGIDKSSASRRVRQAIKAGYLINEEGTRGKPMRLRIGDPMPEEVQVLPTPEQLEKAIGERDKDPTAVWM